jgi:hypothetical protein
VRATGFVRGKDLGTLLVGFRKRGKILAEPQTPEISHVSAPLRKVFQGGEFASPLPVFVNAVDITVMGADALIDAGVVTPEAIQKYRAGQEIVDVQVLFRLAMSVQTLLGMKQRIDEVLKKALEAQKATGANKE